MYSARIPTEYADNNSHDAQACTQIDLDTVNGPEVTSKSNQVSNTLEKSNAVTDLLYFDRTTTEGLLVAMKSRDTVQHALVYTVAGFSARWLLYLKSKPSTPGRREKEKFNDKYYQKYRTMSKGYDMILMLRNDWLALADKWNLGAVARDFVSAVEILPSLVGHEDTGGV